MIDTSHAKKNILCFRSIFLPYSEQFIKAEIENLKVFHPIIFCFEKIKNTRCSNCDVVIAKEAIPDKYLRQVSDLIIKKDIKLLHGLFGFDSLNACIVKHIYPEIPFIASFRGMDIYHATKNYPHLYRDVYEMADLILVRSKQMKKTLISQGCRESKIRVFRTGVDLRTLKFRNKALKKMEEKLEILSVGRLVEKKGMDDAIRCFNEIHKKYPYSNLTIIGDGYLKIKLRSFAKKLGIEKNVHFLGQVSHANVIKYMRRSDIFILASKTAKDGDREGVPNSIKEAMAIGLPVVSTKHSGIPELIENGEEGILAEEGDYLKMAEAADSYIIDYDLRNRIILRARKKIETYYDLEKTMKDFERNYEQLVNKKYQ